MFYILIAIQSGIWYTVVLQLPMTGVPELRIPEFDSVNPIKLRDFGATGTTLNNSISNLNLNRNKHYIGAQYNGTGAIKIFKNGAID